MDLKAILDKLQAMPPGEGPKILHALADVWAADPNILQQVQSKDYLPILAAVTKIEPHIAKDLLAFGFHLFT